MIEKKFDLNLLRVLLALDRTRNVTQASRTLDLSQSGFSTALGKLRREVDDALFVRTPKGMEPTPRAAEMIEKARSLIDTLEDDIKEKRGFHPEESATEFRLAMSDISEMTLLPTLLADLKKVAPRCTVRTMSMGPEQMAVGLESGQIDLAIGYIPELKGGGIFQQQLLVHSFTCLLRIDHPIRSLKLSKSQYEALEHIVVETPIRSQELVDRSIDAKKIKRNIVVRTPHFMSVPFLIAKSDMCATVPAAVGEAHKSTGMLRIVQPPFTPPTFPVRQHWHRRYANDPRSRWLRAFVFHSLHQ